MGIGTPAGYVRAALVRATKSAAREVRLSPEALTLRHADGQPSVQDRAGTPPAGIAECMRPRYREGDGFELSYGRGDAVDAVFPGLGSWRLAFEGDDVVLRAKKPVADCLERLLSSEPEPLSALRRLYAQDGVDVVVRCDGPRARDVALAIVAERDWLGLPSRVGRLSRDRLDRGRDTQAPVADDPFSPPGEAWTVSTEDAVPDDGEGAGSKVTVLVVRRHVTQAAIEGWLAGRARPAAFVEVSLRDSEAVATVFLSPSARALADAAPPLPGDAPWDRFRRAKQARDARPKAPRTWHQTTEAVARAFVAREAPRGYVSNKSIYFHGPVAYSQWDGNPVAAFVKVGRETLLLEGRRSQGGTMAGTTTSAQGDIRAALQERGMGLPVAVGDLSEVLDLGGADLSTLPPRGRRAKDEASLPAACALRKAAFGAWVRAERDRLQGEIDSRVGRAPTFVRATAYEAMARLADVARAVRPDAYGLPPQEVMRDLARADRVAVAAREEERRNRPPPPPRPDVDEEAADDEAMAPAP